jgi:hypothetical protein
MKELEQGTYKIPNGCVCKVEKGVLTIRESKAKKIEGERCRNCKYYATGHSVNNQFYQTTICLKKPRSTKHLRPGLTAVYYHVSPTSKVCELFEKKEQ